MSNRGLDEPSMRNVITTPKTLTPNVAGRGFEQCPRTGSPGHNTPFEVTVQSAAQDWAAVAQVQRVNDGSLRNRPVVFRSSELPLRIETWRKMVIMLLR
jgi:hypothetical protein